MSGYHLYRSSSLASFTRRFPRIFVGEDPLAAPVSIVVQNAGLGEWLSRDLAGRLGAVAGLRLLMPEQALRRFAMGYPVARRRLGGSSDRPDRALLFMDGMKLAVYKSLVDLLDSGTPGSDEFDQIRDYAGEGRGERLWQLADAVAGTLHHYGMNVLSLVDAWESGRAPADLAAEDRASEAWQRRLWMRIFRDTAPYDHLSRILTAIRDSPDSYDGEPARIVLFGSLFLGEAGLGFFRRLAADLDVHHFLLDPGGAEAVESLRTPFLKSNGRLSSGFRSLADILRPDHLDESRENPGPADSLLHRVRESLGEDAPIRGPVSDDGSLEFHDVSDSRRAVEVLKDRILAALHDDAALAPTQIGVLAPDIARFAPDIEAVFRDDDDLPYNLTDLPARSDAPYPAAFRILMDLPGSRFGRGTLLDLFENPCFAPTARDPGLLEVWSRLISDLHVRWGVDEQHRRSAGAADHRTGSWAGAFERLLAGYWSEEGDDPNILPAEVDGDRFAEDAGALMAAVRGLDDDLRRLDGEARTLKEWTLLWERIAETWLRPRRDQAEAEADERDRLRLKKAIRDLLALDDDLSGLSDFDDPRIPWDVFSSLLDETVSKAVGRRGRYLARGVTCASLKPTRAIPFRRIYLLGLDEGDWPGRDDLSGFDLRDRIPGLIDLSREAVDRFAFLETLFSASDHLSLFYTGRDPERGDALAPAAPVQELLDHLGDGSGALIRRHPLAPYDPEVLTGTGPLATLSREALAMARIRSEPISLAIPDSGPVPPRRDDDRLEWTVLARFLKNPVEHFFRRRLGLPRAEGAEDRDESDVLEAGGLDWWSWRDEHIRRNPEFLRNPEELVESFRRRLRLEGAVSETSIAELPAETWLRDARELAAQLDRLETEGLDLRTSFSCRLYPTGEPRDLGDVLDLPAPRISPAGAEPLSIIGVVPGVRRLAGPDGEDARVWTLLDFVSSRSPRSSANRMSWTAALVLAAAAGPRRPREIRVFRMGGRDFKARRYYFHPDRTPAGSGGEKVLWENPAGLLRSLVKVYRDGESAALPLYPELADRMMRILRRGTPDLDESAAAASAWSAIVGDDYAARSDLRDCPYRGYLGRIDFAGSNFRRAWNELYVEGGLLWT